MPARRAPSPCAATPPWCRWAARWSPCAGRTPSCGPPSTAMGRSSGSSSRSGPRPGAPSTPSRTPRRRRPTPSRTRTCTPRASGSWWTSSPPLPRTDQRGHRAMVQPETEVVETDVLILGGGMAGCGAAFEAAYWAKSQGLRVVMVEKAAVERSGAVAMGLSAINLYLGMRWNQNQPEDFVRYVRQDLMGLSREDLVYDIARHVDSSVHMFEEWGLPIFKNPDGTYKREGRWQIMIHGESYKPIVAEATKTAIGEENVYERIFAARLLLDPKDPGRIAGAIGFSVRDNKIYVFKARAVIVAAGGAPGGLRPHAPPAGAGG